MLTTTHRVCHTCTRKVSKYMCPRCNAPYCSLECYKNHNVRCTDEFYGSQLKEMLVGVKASPHDRSNMMSILQRDYEERTKDELQLRHGGVCQPSRDQDQDLVRRFEDLDFEQDRGSLDDDDDDLEDQKLERSRFVLWNPWWTTERRSELKPKRLISPIQQEEESDQIALDIPPLPTMIPHISTLTSASPSVLLRYNICDVMYPPFNLRFKIFTSFISASLSFFPDHLTEFYCFTAY
eukprot:TRINITY_DN9337_c0_g1_i1.p1 TRINITY_DN9337_c0_g1~~TRINITY_DN9337_c0_g1_i1.p1  ORF type:complete len:237 (+),score=24.06 TRINITY_DN9337_c0_g1_i1:69-779(+)